MQTQTKKAADTALSCDLFVSSWVFFASALERVAFFFWIVQNEEKTRMSRETVDDEPAPI